MLSALRAACTSLQHDVWKGCFGMSLTSSAWGVSILDLLRFGLLHSWIRFVWADCLSIFDEVDEGLLRHLFLHPICWFNSAGRDGDKKTEKPTVLNDKSEMTQVSRQSDVVIPQVLVR